MSLKWLNKKYYIAPSKIHGRGVMANILIEPGEPIDVGIDFHFNTIPFVTQHFGSMINHSWTPNAYLKFMNKKHYVIAKKMILPHQEITLDYRDTPWYILGPDQSYV